MQNKVVGLLVGCLVLLLLAIVLIGLLGGGLDARVRARAEAEMNNLSSASVQLVSAREEVEQALSADAMLFESEQVDRLWVDRLEEADTRMQKAAAAATQLTELLEKNDKDDLAAVEEAIQTIQTARVQASNDVDRMRDTARRLLEFKKQLAEKMPQLQADYDKTQAFDLSALKLLVEKASIDWPDKQTDLERRLAVYSAGILNASLLWNSSKDARERALKGEAKGADIVALINVSNRLDSLLTSLEAAEEKLPKLIDQLYCVWDKVLSDMEIQEGAVVTFRQQFQTNRYRVEILAEGKEEEGPDVPAEEPQTEWKTVNKQTFESMKTKLGMTVQHKPAGKYDHEATSMVQPPGYAYMCPVKENRNHYGYWRRHSGGYYSWYFYRPYYPMRSRLFGSSYSPVTSHMYGDYDMHRQSGRTYFGSDNSGRQLYGSKGTATKQRYASSGYVRTNGYSNTQYAKSGGTYRGSRYATSSRSTSRSSSGSSYSSSSYSRSRGSSSLGGK